MHKTVHHRSSTIDIVAFSLLLILIPYALSLIRPTFLNNVAGDWDNWMYYGYIRHLFQYASAEIWDANRYLGTRIAYFLPGHLLYLVFGDDGYRFAFNLGLCCTTIVLCFFYITRTYLSLRIAVSISVLLATDLYFLRSMGWDYVDKAVLTYEMLTLACLTAARIERRRHIMTVAAGFFAASMLFVHVASAILFPLFLVYSGFVVQNARSAKDWGRHCLGILVYGTLGAVLAQALFGTLMVVLQGGDFFFFVQQLNVIQTNIAGWNADLSRLMTDGYWITVPLAAFVGAALSLAAKPFRTESTRFEIFWLWAVLILYGVIFVGEATGRLWLLSRDGMHSTILAPFSFITFGILLYRQEFRGMIALTCMVFTAAFLVRAGLGSGAGLADVLDIPMAALAMMIGLLLALSFVASSPRTSAIAIVLIGLLSAFNPAHFADDRAVRLAHAQIDHLSNGRLPSIFYDRDDPELLFIWSVLSSFTDRALFVSRDTYPALRDGLVKGDLVVIASSQVTHEADARAALLASVMSVRLAATFQESGVWFYVFEVENAKEGITS